MLFEQENFYFNTTFSSIYLSVVFHKKTKRKEAKFLSSGKENGDGTNVINIPTRSLHLNRPR